MKKEIQVGSKLFYTDSKKFMGEVVKILKYSVWVKHENGQIEKRFPLRFAVDMANVTEDHTN